MQRAVRQGVDSRSGAPRGRRCGTKAALPLARGAGGRGARRRRAGRKGRELVASPAAFPPIVPAARGARSARRLPSSPPCRTALLPQLTAMSAAAPAIIADRGEFIDVLRALWRGHMLVQASEEAGGWLLDGGRVLSSHRPLLRYGLVREVVNPQGFEHVRYFRLTERGRAFAARAIEAWRQRPLLERLLVRLLG